MEFGKTVEAKPNTAFRLENQSNSKPAQLQFSISKKIKILLVHVYDVKYICLFSLKY